MTTLTDDFACEVLSVVASSTTRGGSRRTGPNRHFCFFGKAWI